MGAAVSCDPLDMRSGRFFIIAYPIFSESKLNILPAQIAVKYHPYALASLLQQPQSDCNTNSGYHGYAYPDNSYWQCPCKPPYPVLTSSHYEPVSS